MNYTIGIRTPWTLDNEKVWDATHALGSKLFYASGAIALLGFFLPEYAIVLLIAPVLLSAIATVAYSYLKFRKLPKKR